MHRGDSCVYGSAPPDRGRPQRVQFDPRGRESREDRHDRRKAERLQAASIPQASRPTTGFSSAPPTGCSRKTSDIWRGDLTTVQEFQFDGGESRPMTGMTGFTDFESRPGTSRTNVSEDLYMVNGIMPTRYPSKELQEEGVRPDTSRIYHPYQPNFEQLSGERLPVEKKRPAMIKKKGAFHPQASVGPDMEDSRPVDSRPGTGATGVSQYARKRSDVTGHYR